MSAVLPADVRRRRDDLVLRASRAADPAEIFAEASRRLRQLIPFDAAAWHCTDPGTGMPTAPARIEGVGGVTQEQCSTMWRREFTGHDFLRYHDLARASVPAGSLRATAGDPLRSWRYRGFLRPLGFDDELRGVLRVAGNTWGLIALLRREGQRPFTVRDTQVVADLSEPLGAILRLRSQPTDFMQEHARHDQPGLLVFDDRANLISINDAARAWLAELPHEDVRPTEVGVELPVWMIAAAHRARAEADHGVEGTTRLRLRTRRGGWLVCHASCLRDTRDAVSTTAIVLQPAKPAAIAPIIVEAYDLTMREQEITRSIVRGASTAEIAHEHALSTHTVRDHVKAILKKAGVSSRGELIAKLFAEFYEPLRTEGIIHADELV